jgi:hypothetical protein
MKSYVDLARHFSADHSHSLSAACGAVQVNRTGQSVAVLLAVLPNRGFVQLYGSGQVASSRR